MSKDFSNLLGGAIANKDSNESDIRNKIVIRESLKSLIPPLSQEELSQLETNIFSEGVREPLVLWQVDNVYVLIDGHNRFSICQKFKLNFPFKLMGFNDEEEAKDWMVRNQLGRRNLSHEQQSYLRGLRYNQGKSQGKRSDLTSGQNDQKLNSENTALSLSKEYNVSPKTIVRDGEFAKGVEAIGKNDPELKRKILKGESKITKGKIQSLGKSQQKMESVIKEDEIAYKPLQKRLSAEDVSRIAFDFIMQEKVSPKVFYQQLGRDAEHIDPLEFFQVWDENRKSKPNENV